MSTRILIFLLAICCTTTAVASDNNSSFTLYLVRHAEKQQDGSRDPELTETGEQRSRELSSWFSDKNIDDIWSSDYKRTRDTAKPILTKLNIGLSIYDPGKLPELSAKLLRNQHTALIVGHSNTTPQLASLLCKCEIAEMDESEHDRLIVISVNDGTTSVETLQQQ